MNEYDEWSLEEMYLQEASDREEASQEVDCVQCGGRGYDKESWRKCQFCGGDGVVIKA